MSNNKFQAKLTEAEIEAALQSVALKVCMEFNEDVFERFTYLGKRLLKIKKGEVEVEVEVETNEVKQPPAATTWS